MDYNKLLLKLYRLSHESPIDAFQDSALKLIKPLLAFDASMWGTATGTESGIDIHTIHLHEKSPEMLVAYEPLKHQDSAAAAMLGQRQATRGFHTANWFCAPQERELREMLRTHEQENIFITAQSDPESKFVHWITLFRADPDAHCTVDQVQLLAQLAPHLMQALALNRVMHLDRIGPVSAPARGSAIADLRGVLYHADSDFDTMIRAEWSDWHSQALPRPLLEHFLQGHHRFHGNALVVSHRVEQGLLFLKARPRCRADNLTPREHTIALLVAKGGTYKEIAQTLNRSPATVRNHIQATYEKLQVGNIAGLITEIRLAD